MFGITKINQCVNITINTNGVPHVGDDIINKIHKESPPFFLFNTQIKPKVKLKIGLLKLYNKAIEKTTVKTKKVLLCGLPVLI